MHSLRDNKDGSCNCKPLMGECFFTDGFNGKCDCKSVSCPHRKKESMTSTETWDEEFDEKWNRYLYENVDTITYKKGLKTMFPYQFLKDFIRETREEAYDKGYYDGEKNEFENQTRKFAGGLSNAQLAGSARAVDEMIQEVRDGVEKEAYARGRRDENKRLEEAAKDYQNHGFELDTFIYSGFLPGLDDPDFLFEAAQEEGNIL